MFKPAFAIFLLCTPAFLSASFVSMPPEEAVAEIDALVQKKAASKGTGSDLIEALKSPEASVRLRERAAWALGELDVKAGVPALLEACKNKGLLVRSAAMNSLIHLRAAQALNTLIAIAEKDPILSLRQNATLGLGLLLSDKAIEPLVKLSEDPTPEVRGAVALSMAALQSKKNDFSEALKQMEADPNPYVQDRAKMGLDVARGKKEAVLNHLQSPDSDIRLFAALYFYFHGTSKELPALKDAWNGEAEQETRNQLARTITAVKKRSAGAAKTPATGKKKRAKPKKAPAN